MSKNLNKSEAETYRTLKKLPLDQLMNVLNNELGDTWYFEFRNGRWRPILACWKIIRRHGWTSEEFKNASLDGRR